MPRKAKPRKPVASSEEVWIAPRPANTQPKRIEPVGTVRSNRYLDFADIALGGKKPVTHKKKNDGFPFHRPLLNDQHDQEQQREHESGGKVTPINRHKSSNIRNANEGFGAFRNPR